MTVKINGLRYESSKEAVYVWGDNTTLVARIDRRSGVGDVGADVLKIAQVMMLMLEAQEQKTEGISEENVG